METGKRDGAGNPMFVWQDYVAGTDPTDPGRCSPPRSRRRGNRRAGHQLVARTGPRRSGEAAVRRFREGPHDRCRVGARRGERGGLQLLPGQRRDAVSWGGGRDDETTRRRDDEGRAREKLGIAEGGAGWHNGKTIHSQTMAGRKRRKRRPTGQHSQAPRKRRNCPADGTPEKSNPNGGRRGKGSAGEGASESLRQKDGGHRRTDAARVRGGGFRRPGPVRHGAASVFFVDGGGDAGKDWTWTK